MLIGSSQKNVNRKDLHLPGSCCVLTVADLNVRRVFAGSLGRSVGEDLAVADMHHAVRVLGNIRLVRNQHDRVASSVQRVEKSHDFHAGL